MLVVIEVLGCVLAIPERCHDMVNLVLAMKLVQLLFLVLGLDLMVECSVRGGGGVGGRGLEERERRGKGVGQVVSRA